jgi:hypothetical protein
VIGNDGMNECVGRPARGGWWKSVTVKEWRTAPAPSDARGVREGLCHVNLNWPREVSTTQFEFMRLSQLATSGKLLSEDAERAAGCEMGAGR